MPAGVPAAVAGGGIGVRLHGAADEPLAGIAALPSVNYLATTLGQWGAIGGGNASAAPTATVPLNRNYLLG